MLLNLEVHAVIVFQSPTLQACLVLCPLRLTKRCCNNVRCWNWPMNYAASWIKIEHFTAIWSMQLPSSLLDPLWWTYEWTSCDINAVQLYGRTKSVDVHREGFGIKRAKTCRRHCHHLLRSVALTFGQRLYSMPMVLSWWLARWLVMPWWPRPCA